MFFGAPSPSLASSVAALIAVSAGSDFERGSCCALHMTLFEVLPVCSSGDNKVIVFYLDFETSGLDV